MKPPVFARLRAILQRHAGGLTVKQDTTKHFSLEAPVGPATIQAWRGKRKSEAIPVAWVEIGKGYVSYHLMGVYGNPKLLEHFSPELRARMQGKSCFNFKTVDEELFKELERLTADSIAGMRRAGFIGSGKPVMNDRAERR